MKTAFPLFPLFPALLSLFCRACPQAGNFPTGSNGVTEDIFNRFTTQRVLSAASLPPQPTSVEFFPASPEFLVLGKAGEVCHFVLTADSAARLGSFVLPEVAPAPAEIGLTDVAFDPQFARNGFVYFCFSTGDNRWNRIVRVQWSNNYQATANSLAVILNVDRQAPGRAWHGIYSLAFGGDGHLYAALGDATQSQYAQDPASLLGKLIRIAPRESGGYDIPADNPLRTAPNTRGEIVALGLRSPFRLLAWQGGLLLADVGSNQFEEINLYTGGAVNFGWPECEGVCSQPGFRNPILAISHRDPTYQNEDPEAIGELRHSLSLGVVYEGAGEDPYKDLLDGRLLFNDVFLGYIRAVKIARTGELSDNKHICHHVGVTSMTVGPQGYIYGSALFAPQIFRLVLKPAG
ncbi:MAG: PQQ-dependent sugar dehydrogenase [candidate division KSB1 bacterium]|nr:PQQ-dependent sugar dehydrogenase [candidate division KSB1 bacterium]MDZ7354753.1 PQQ-dependent sugar dehydrogenase [candidate division KSB1 bacterium]MDZ7397709.1 PQQ-dependent sugar dehydrogenase [candidate division KSB1 bacterium]